MSDPTIAELMDRWLLAVEDNAAMPTEPSEGDPPKRKHSWFRRACRRADLEHPS